MHHSIQQRWLQFSGVSTETVSEKLLAAQQRAKRYPRPYCWIYPFAAGLVNTLLPLFLMGKFSRAANLSPTDFEEFCVRLKACNPPLLRMLGFFAIAPLMEVLADEQTQEQEQEHPLEKQLSMLQGDCETDYDVLIIGSGAGGAPAALRLSEQGLKTAVIEQGDILRMDKAPRILEKHYIGQGLTASLNGGMLITLAGQTVGGTTSINSGTCLNPLEKNLERWNKKWGTFFSGKMLKPWLQQAAEQIGVCIPPATLLSKSAALFDKGLKALGRQGAYILPRNAPGCKGAGRCCFACPHHAKQSTDLSFLPQAIAKGAALFANAKAIAIEEKDNLVHITVQQYKMIKTFSCKKLIIAAGAFYTPGLLKRNSLGSALNKAGKFLKIHPATKVFAYFPGLQHGETGIPQGMGYKPPELEHITLEGIHTPKSLTAPILSVAGKKFNWWMEHSNDLASFGLMVQDRGRGRVLEIASFPYTFYKLHRQDARDIGEAVLLIARAFFAAGAEKVLLPLSGKLQKEFNSVAELAVLKPEDFKPQSFIISGFHPQGTAGIGRVVDNNLQLLGAKNIFVCDASVLPDSPGVNPMMTIMALSLRLGDFLGRDR
ncbi:MAG: putative GMC-type oxidoreductase [Bacteroidia bacterium]|nr:putative GMC-type oxidoreductase [Bacteroidia bacterium]